MIIFGFYLLKVFGCSALLYLYYHLALRNKIFHQWNRFYLLFAVIISLAAPLLTFNLFSQTTTEANQSIHLLRVVQSANEYLDEVTITGQQAWGTSQWGITVYLCFAVVFFLLLLHSLARIYFLIRRHHVQSVAGIRFVNTNAAGAPFSFFRYIFWHQSIDVQSATGQKIFQHELVHVSEKHSLDTLFMQMILILFWCNPFFWLIRKELKVIHEFIADKKSVGEGGSAAFAAMVLQSTYPDQFNSLVNSFFQTSIKRRILMLKKLQTPRLSYLSRMLALPVIVCSVLAFTVKSKRVETVPLDRTITVVIDAGHGVQHNGVKEGAMANGMSEEEIVLSIAKNIQKMNGNKNIHIVLTRASQDIVDLHKRVDIARENKADLFISLHMSAAVQNEARTQGMDIYVSNKQ
ncbi:MAG: N-acetylmuramoyl-L-alanine amidase, partial [Flavisolibacter sp.]